MARELLPNPKDYEDPLYRAMRDDDLIRESDREDEGRGNVLVTAIILTAIVIFVCGMAWMFWSTTTASCLASEEQACIGTGV
jgi:multisubunit Na+/H+ antiporter MnhC subunit